MTKKILSTVLTVTALVGGLTAQSPKTQGLLMALSTNAKQMVTWEWKQKTTVVRKGSPAGFKIDEVRFDASGQPQRISLSQPEERRMGPLRARKVAEVKSTVEDVMRLAANYTHPQQVAQAIRRGEIWEGQGILKVKARAVLHPADEVSITVNGATYLPARMEITTSHEGNPVRMFVDYQPLPGGPNMMSRLTVQIPEESVVVNVESFDFRRLAGPGMP